MQVSHVTPKDSIGDWLDTNDDDCKQTDLLTALVMWRKLNSTAINSGRDVNAIKRRPTLTLKVTDRVFF